MTNEFSITLPSNVFSKEDPNNTPSKYVTRLNRTIQLSGDWEVAATRLQLQNRWYNFTKPQLLGVYVRDIRTSENTYAAGTGLRTGIIDALEPPKEKHFNRLILKWKDASCATAFVKNMTYRCITFPAGIYTSLDQVGMTLCDLIANAFEDRFEDLELQYKFIAPIKTAQLSIETEDDNSKLYVVRIVSLGNPTDLDVMETLGFTKRLSGFVEEGKTHYKFYGGVDIPTKEIIARTGIELLKRHCGITTKVVNNPTVPEVRQLMLYADVAALRNVGSIEAQLLDTVVVHAKLGDCEDALRGVTPNYVPVYRNTFSTIEIQLTDYVGDPLSFPSDSTSPVIVTLRFRKVNSSL
jgi:hypothetical protein